MVEGSRPTAIVAANSRTTAGYGGEPVGDEDGYLAIGLAALVVAIVGVTVVMILLAATCPLDHDQCAEGSPCGLPQRLNRGGAGGHKVRPYRYGWI